MPTIARIFVDSLLTTLALASSFAVANEEVPGLKCSAFRETFFSKSISIQIAEFTNYDIESQYAIYICGTQTREPPSMHLAMPFAKEGTAAVSLLKWKLAAAKSDLTVRDTLFVFEVMARQKNYDVAGDNDLMRVIDDAVARVNEPSWKRQCEQAVKEIQGGK